MNPSSFTLHPSSFHLGLIGYPLGHSLSPQIYAAALKACGLRGDYSLFPIAPDDAPALKKLLARLRSGEIHGLNVTIPHKQNVIPLLDELTPTAQAIGAVNTIYLRGEKLIGENTDAAGFLSDLKKYKGNQELENRKSALILGAGGAARAVIYALLTDGWKAAVAARRIEQAQQLANSFSSYKVQVTNFSSFILYPSSFILIVNATPLGMFPAIDASPLPENFHLPADTFIYDLVYNPRETKLVKDARAQGLQAATGLGMLIEQAALAFEIWTGCHPPRETLWVAVE